MRRLLFQLTSVAAIALLVTSCGTLPGGGGDGQLAIGIDTESDVEHADIFLEGQFLTSVHKGEPNKEFDMPAGYYRMRIVADGYEKWEREIQVVGGNDYQEVHVRLQRILAFLNQVLWDWTVV